MPGKVKWLWSINGNGNSNSNVVTLDTSQTITGPKQFNGATQFQNVVTIHNTTSQDVSLAMYRETTKANFAGFFNGNVRQGFIGKQSANDTNITVKAETGDLVLDCVDTSHSINVSNKNISNLATPSQNNHAATKQYVDNAITNGNWTTIVNINSNISSLNDNFTQIVDYTSFSNFSMGNGNTYEVMFKCNVDSTDIYCSGICASNATSYDNIGFTNTMYWGDSSGIIFKFSLNNNRIKIWAKRNGSNTNWNTHTRVYIRKIMNGGIQ